MLSTKIIIRPKAVKYVRFFSQSSKFPEGTIPGIIKEARAKNEWKDCVRFDSQNFNWTTKEIDIYTSAFAYGLLEQGYQPGDKLLLWVDQENSAEIATAQIGAMKAGCSVVTVDNGDEIDDIAKALKSTGSKGLMLSPHTRLDGKNQRVNLLLEIMPELARAYPGQALEFKDFPKLQHIIHTGHVTIRGTTKFKENMLYTKKALTNFRLAGCSPKDLAFESYHKGSLAAALTHREIVDDAKGIYDAHLKSEDKLLPVFLTISLQYPLGLATFLGSTYGERKVFIPSTYNVAKIAKSFHYQKSDVLVCEDDVFSFEPPAHKLDEVKEHVSNFKKALVASHDKETKTNVFTGLSATHTNFYLQ